MLLLAVAAPAWAAVYTVDPAGGADFTDLPAAVAMAGDGSTLVLAPGTYDSVTVEGKLLALEASDRDAVTLLGLTTVRADVTLRGVRFVEAPEPVLVLGGRLLLDGVGFVGDVGTAAVRAAPGSTVELVGADFDHVVATEAAVVVDEASLTVRDSRFGDGVGGPAGALLATASSVSVVRTSFVGNRGTVGAGAVAMDGGAGAFEGCDFSANLGDEGGAIAAAGSRLTGTDLVFTDDGATRGGHVYLRDGAEGRLTRVWMAGGEAEEGGGIAVENASLSATNVVLHQGEALDVGGGLFLAGGVADLRYAVVTGNTGGLGGGLAVDDGVLSLRGVIVVDNHGGDVASASATPVLVEASLLRQAAGAVTGAVTTGAGVLWGAPEFVDGAAGDYALASLSPGLDAGPYGEGDLDGTAADMGAYGGPSAWELPDGDGDGEVRGRDCDDADPSVRLGAPEVWYDGIDQDCEADDDYDQDQDGFRSALFDGDDCNDVDPTVNPDASEAPGDHGDMDCDGLAELDGDGDGWPVTVDCDDGDPATFPGAPDTWYDGVDRDCDGGSDYDADGDGGERGMTDCDDADPTVYTGAPEVADDGVDQDCDGADLHAGDLPTESAAGGTFTPNEPNFRGGMGCSSLDDLGLQGMAAFLAVLALTGRRRLT